MVTYSKSMDQPGKVVNPARSQLNRKNWSRDTGPAFPSRVSLLISIFTLNRVLTYGIPPEFRGGVRYLFKNRHTPSGQSQFIGPRNCVPMAFTAESPSAQG